MSFQRQRDRDYESDQYNSRTNDNKSYSSTSAVKNDSNTYKSNISEQQQKYPQYNQKQLQNKRPYHNNDKNRQPRKFNQYTNNKQYNQQNNDIQNEQGSIPKMAPQYPDFTPLSAPTSNNRQDQYNSVIRDDIETDEKVLQKRYTDVQRVKQSPAYVHK